MFFSKDKRKIKKRNKEMTDFDNKDIFPPTCNWVVFRFGGDPILTYIVFPQEFPFCDEDNYNSTVVFGCPTWPSNARHDVNSSRLNGDKSIFITKAKLRWWFKFLPEPYKSIVCPYQKPFSKKEIAAAKRKLSHEMY